jgi:hypothetical protein
MIATIVATRAGQTEAVAVTMSYEPTLDHLVYAGPDLVAVVEAVHAATGVRPVQGGRHVGRGTRNHLLGLGAMAYLEVIGPDPDQPEPDLPRPFGVDRLTGPRLVAWAVRPPDLDATVTRARHLGRDPGPVTPMARRTPAGGLLSWRLTVPQDGVDGGVLPFLIDWGDSVHPTAGDLPTVPLVALTARHPDPAWVLAGLQALGVTLEVRPSADIGLTAVLSGRRGPVRLG